MENVLDYNMFTCGQLSSQEDDGPRTRYIDMTEELAIQWVSRRAMDGSGGIDILAFVFHALIL